MNSHSEEILSIFQETKALLNGHFILRSGLRSRHFFQCAQVCQHIDKVTRLAEIMIKEMPFKDVATVVAPAMGGLVLGQEVARQLNTRFIFLEKVDDKLALRRNFKLSEDEKVLLLEDVVTRGGRVQEAINIIESFRSDIIGVCSLVDRSVGDLDFGIPYFGLLKMNFPTYSPEAIPEDLAKIPPTKPGS